MLALLTNLSDYEMAKSKCRRGHTYTRNKWLQYNVPNLCLDCDGPDRAMTMIARCLKGTALLSTDPLQILLNFKYPETKDALRRKYICTCSIGHVWETTVEEVLKGKWCGDCLMSKITSIQILDDIATTKRGRCLTSPLIVPSNATKCLFVCQETHIFHRYPIDIVYGKWCLECGSSRKPDLKKPLVIDEELDRPKMMQVSTCQVKAPPLIIDDPGPDEALQTMGNWFTIINLSDYTVKYRIQYAEIPNPSHIVTIRCSKGHIFEAAPIMHHPTQWCSHPDCNGIDASVSFIMSKLGGSMKLIFNTSPEGYEEYRNAHQYAKEGTMFEYRCSIGHTWIGNVKSILHGKWCDVCLCDGYHSDEAKKLLAKTFKGRYDTNKRVFLCNSGAQIGRLDAVLRGERCSHDHHEKCMAINTWLLSTKQQEAIKIQCKSVLTKRDKIDALRKLDKTACLTNQQIESAVDSFPRDSIETLYLKAKYDTIEKVRYWADINGCVCTSENRMGFSSKLEWECKQMHFGQRIKWEATVEDAHNGRWCKFCRLESFERYLLRTRKHLKKRISKGHEAVRYYLIKKGIRFIEEKTFKECRFVKKLRFDFYLPDLNILIEFDGCQHFRPVLYFGGARAFETQVLKDNIKADYCRMNRITLIRVNNLKSVCDDLDKLLSLPRNFVMAICIDTKYTNICNARWKVNNMDYAPITF